MLSFAVGQPAVQLLNVLTGFFLLRWLSREEFAMFGVAFAFQSTVNQLTDLGFTGSIVALAGERGTDPAWLGRYLRSARHFRGRLMVVTLGVAAVAFPLLAWRQEWGAGVKLLLFGAVAAAVVFQGGIMYGSPLLANRRLRDYYSPQIIGAAVRLFLCAALHFMGLLSAWGVAWLGALVVGWTGWSYRRAAQDCAQEPAKPDPEANHEMRRYLAPLMPAVVFNAVQGQLAVLIIAWLGSTEKIAEVSALGRIGQLFLLVHAFNGIMIGPYVARLPMQLLSRRYTQILFGAVLLAVLIGASGFLFSRQLLWLLGSKYSGLEREAGWVVLSACVNYVAGVMWTMNSARRWVFWWGTAAEIIALVLVQAGCALTMDLSQTMPVIWFGLFTVLTCFGIHAATAIYGFKYGGRLAN